MQKSPATPSRRGFFMGAATAGAATAALVSLRSAPELASSAAPPLPVPEHGGGYSLSEHVKRYYKTARV